MTKRIGPKFARRAEITGRDIDEWLAKRGRIDRDGNELRRGWEIDPLLSQMFILKKKGTTD